LPICFYLLTFSFKDRFSKNSKDVPGVKIEGLRGTRKMNFLHALLLLLILERHEPGTTM
jgi:hypothetical protein